jgi:hypothetical protein
MFVGCEAPYQVLGLPNSTTKNAAIISYDYDITGNDTTTFSKTPKKVYRFVDEDGYLLFQLANGQKSSIADGTSGLGQGLATISDTELVIDDTYGNIYYADLTNIWSGNSIYTGQQSGLPVHTFPASNSIDVNGNAYLDLNTVSPQGGPYAAQETEITKIWEHCTYETNQKIYTVVAKKIIGLNDVPQGPGLQKVQGDMKFIPSDPILSGDPSVVVTFKKYGILDATNYEGCPQNPGYNSGPGSNCMLYIGRFKFPTDTNNIDIQTFADVFTDDPTSSGIASVENSPAQGSINIVEDSGTGTLYSFSRNYRWEINPNTLDYSNPVQAEFRLYNNSGIGTQLNWYWGVGETNRMNFRGGAQAPDCLTTSAYTYNCTNTGCESVLGSSGAYETFSACSADCVSYSCTTSCDCVTGTTLDTFGISDGYFGYDSQNPGVHLSEYRYASNNLVNIQSTNLGDKCAWPIYPGISIYPGTTGDFELDYGKGSLYQIISPDFMVMGVNDSNNQQSSWGINGTRFCLNDDCTNFVDLTGTGPSGVASGFWGSTGDYLYNSRLNRVGVFPNNIDTHAPSFTNLLQTQNDYTGSFVLNYIASPSHIAAHPQLGPLAQGYGGAGWKGIARQITVTGQTKKVYYIGVGSSEYYRIGIDGVIQIDTSRPSIANRGFNPNSQPVGGMGTSNQDVIDATGSGNESSLWWMHRFELEPGDHGITVEMFAMASQDNPKLSTTNLAVPNATRYKALGVDIVGPFDVGTYDDATSITNNLTPEIYTANTLFSTSELAEPSNIATTCNLGQCYLSTCYQVHYAQQPIPFTVLGSLMSEYPDPYRVAAGLGGQFGWENPALDPITLPNGGIYAPAGCGNAGVPCVSMNEKPYYAPKTNGVQTTHPGTNTLTRDLQWSTMGYVTEDPTNTPYAGLPGAASSLTVGGGGWRAFIPAGGQNPDPCESPNVSSFWGAGDTYQLQGSTLKVLGINPNKQFNAGSRWTDIIDWLNSEGLMVSSVADPGTNNYPNIDYNATFWQVMYAMADYWTAAFPNGAPNGNNPGGQSTYSFSPGNAGGPFFTYSCYNWCDCEQSTAMLDTQVNNCGALQTSAMLESPYGFLGNGFQANTYHPAQFSNPEWNPVTTYFPALNYDIYYQRDWIYDALYGACVTTTGCTVQNTLNFSGGCVPIDGTGYTNNNVYDTLADCEENCGSGTTTGITYYECTDSGCTTASTVTPFTSLTQCTGSCISYNCTTTGCTEFNPPASTANIGLAPNAYGTGGTFTDASLCYSSCTSYNCGNWGCSQYVGTGGTYLTEALCTGSCISYECLDNGCVGYEGSGYTYSSTTDCQDVCVSYECTTNCCQLWNAPFYGTGGTFFDYTSSATSLTDCQNECVSWGCNPQLISQDTDIFAYYDTTSMGFNQVLEAFAGVSAWTQTLNNWSGNIRHVLTSDERWLSWGSIPYTGVFTGGTYGVSSTYVSNTVLQWAYNEGIEDIWWTQNNSGQTTGLFDNSGNAVITTGLPDPVPYSSDILNIVFLDESNPSYTPSGSYPNNETDFFIDPQYNAASGPGAGNPGTQHWHPTNKFKDDYDGYTVTWNNVTANTADLKCFIYPTGVMGGLINNQAPTYGGISYGSAAYSQLALNVVASIDEGNQTDGFGNPTPDGTWTLGTSPRPAAFGGVLGGTPGLCPVAKLTALELPVNPYVDEGYGYLVRKGWGYNVTFPTFTNSLFQNDLESFLTQGTAIIFPASGNTGCVSACTQPTAQLPYSSQTDCQSGSTDCQYFTCTDTGCELVPFGTASTFSTLFDCEQSCKSWNCSNVSAISLLNQTSPCEEMVGTGGTFSLEVDCLSLCTSYECFGYDVTTGPQNWGCQSIGGTGATFPTYSACSADCKSWECSSPCSGGTNSGCTQFPYTGLTYSSETECNTNCVQTWWCTPETTIDQCSGRTLTNFIVNTNIDGSPGLQSIGDAIANPNNGYQFTNLSTLKYEDEYEWNTTGPNGANLAYHSNTCIGPSGYFVYKINYIESDLLPGGPWYTYNDFIQTAISTGIVLVNLTLSWVDVTNAIASYYQAPTNMNYTRIVKQRCECEDIGCGVQCENGLYPTVPTSWTGPFTTSGDAYTTCCANTWDCTEGYEISSCSGRTNINVGVQYSNSVEAVNYVSQNLPNVDVSTLYYESDVLVSTLTNPCLGPNGGPLMKLQAFDYPTLNNGISYGQWNYFIQDLIAQGLSGVSSGMSWDIVSQSLFTVSGTALDACVSPCRCITVDCDCFEVEGSGGTYSTEAECLSALTNNTGPCDCDSVSGTSWNCYDEGPYEPTCGTKPNIGLFGTVYDVVDFYRTTLPNLNFNENRFTHTTGIVANTLNTYSISPLTWNDMWVNMSATTYDWMDCFHEFNNLTYAPYYRPYKNIWWIAHPQLTGGNGVFNPASGYWEYPTWNDFYGAAVAAGAPVTTLMSYSSVCQTLDTYFNPGGTSYQCMTRFEDCCSSDDCYCVQQWGTGGTYATEALCEPDCCPVPESGYTCSYGFCVPAAITAIPFFATLNDCNNCLSDPNCTAYTECVPITYDCESGTTTSTCSDSPPIDTIAPGTLGNQLGIPFTTNPITYPFSSDTLTTNLGLLTPFAQSENVFTDHVYWDASVPYSSATYEINSVEYTSGQLTLPTDICIGPNGYPQFRLMSIGHEFVNNGFEYSTWEAFVSVASASPYNFNISVLTTASDVSSVLPPGVTNGWNVTIEPCLCTDIDCGCVPVIGYPLGQYSTSGLCEQFCCDPEVTYDCTINGCVDPGTGLGAYTGFNAFNLCASDCHEWKCNELLPPDCECEWIVGTGNTGTNVYPGTPAGYYSCSTGCCETVVIPQCPILLSVNDSPVTSDAGIYYYDMNSNISQAIFTDPGYTFQDVSYWQSPVLPVTPPDMLVFTYKPDEIKEWYVTSNVIPTLNRTINLSLTIGRGLTNVTQFKLLSANFDVYEIDLVNSTNTTANITSLFSLPAGYKCTGDISFDSNTNLMLVLYDNATTGVAVPTYKLGKYNYNGILLDEYTIPLGFLDGIDNNVFDGIICNVGPSQSIYVVRRDGKIFEVIQTPTLSIAPVPYHAQGALNNISSTNDVTGAEGMCGCNIEVPETYDCVQIAGSNTTQCIDPGNGTGQYTYLTALAGGYLSALDECELNCVNDCTSWSCVTETVFSQNSCANDTLIPFGGANNLTSMFDWLSLNGILTTFADYHYEQSIPGTGGPSWLCTGPNVGGYMNLIQIIKCQTCPDPAMQQSFTNFADFISTANSLGIPLAMGQTFLQMHQLILNHYNPTTGPLNQNSTIQIAGAACTCQSTINHYCVEISGTSGYVTEQECLDNCPDNTPAASPCRSIYAIPSCNFGPLYNDEVEALTQTVNCCVTIDGLTPTQGMIGSVIQDPNTGYKYKVSQVDPCRSVMGCSCSQPYNYVTTTCGEPGPTPRLTQSNSCLDPGCPEGQVFNYNTCTCGMESGLTVFKGDSAHISVMVSDFTKKPLQEVTSEVGKQKELLDNSDVTNCTSDIGEGGRVLYGGCLTKLGHNTHQLRWNTQEQSGNKSTFTCVEGRCIELVGNSGGFTTLVECLQHCDTIGGDGSRPSFLPPVDPRVIDEANCEVPVPRSNVGPTTNAVTNTVTVNRGYVCQSTLNTLVGEYQKACVPLSKAVTSDDSVNYDSLQACLDGCGGWFNCNVDNVDVDGVKLPINSTAPVVMACESLIMDSTNPITVNTINTNCCDGTDIWFPLYNVFGINKVINSTLSYTNRRLSLLISSDICTVSEEETTYTRQGITPIRNGISVPVCGNDSQIKYIDGEPCYPTVAEALSDASTRGCTGYHTHMVEGRLCYMACTSHSQANARMTAGGPCICREYQTQPDGSNKCIRWSPPGCGDAPFMTADEPTRMVSTPATRVNTPTVTRTSTGNSYSSGGMSSGGRTSSGGGGGY